MAARTNRGAREANNADLGERGRRTGIAMPKEGDIPLTQDGYEDMDAYFKSPEAAHASARKKQVNIGGFTPGRGSQSQSQIPGSAGRRPRPARPDVAHELGVRGRKTGMPIVNNNRMPLTADGMEQMDPFFAQGPASIPPVARAGHRRGSKAIQAVVDDLQADSDGDEEEAGQDQTANYGRHAGTSRTVARPSTSTSIAEEDEEDDDQEDAEEEDQEEASKNSQSEDDQDDSEEESQAPTPKASTSNRRKSYASTSANTSYQDNSLNGQAESEEGEDEEIDAGGTQTMDLETSSYFNKSTRSLGNLAASSSRRRHSNHTEDYDTVPSPSHIGSSGSGRAKNARNASSIKSQRVQALASDASSDDEAIEQSLTGQSSASRRQSMKGQRRRSLQDDGAVSPVDKKGKQAMGKRSQIAARSAADDSSGDEMGEASGWQPADNDNAGIREFDDGPDGGGYDGMEDDQEDGNLQGDANDASEDEEQDQEEEDGGLEPIQEEDEDEEDARAEEPTPKANKGKKRRIEPDDSGHGEAVQKAAPQRKRKKMAPEDPSGLRRSSRDRTAPVEYWRNEKVIYRRRDSGINCYYEKIGVESKPRGPIRSLTKRPGARSASASSQQRKKPSSNGRLRSLSASSADEHEMQRPDMSEWDRETDPDGIVWDYVEGKEHRRRIAWTKAMLDPKPTKHQGYQFQRIFTDGVFMAGGWLVIPPGCNKPLKPARDNTYMLFCAQGAVRVLLHRTEFTIAEGGFFLIPRGNSYQINNLTDIDAKLAFMQSREISAVVDDGDAAGAQEN